MPYTYTLTSIIPASPQEIYDAWLDSVAHSAMTGREASMSDEIGAEVSAWDGYITGRNLELVPGERIVQSWRTDEFGDEREDSTITLTFEEMDDGTLLTLVHSNVPDEHRSYEEGGWESQYFEPMKVYFANLEQAEAAEADEAEQEAPVPAPSEAPVRVRRPAAGKAKQPARRAKAAGPKKKTKRAAAAKSRRKTAKPSAGKAVRRAAPRKAAPKSKSGRRKRGRR